MLNKIYKLRDINKLRRSVQIENTSRQTNREKEQWELQNIYILWTSGEKASSLKNYPGKKNFIFKLKLHCACFLSHCSGNGVFTL